MASRNLPTQEHLKTLFNYNQETGICTWKKRPEEAFKTSHGYAAYCKCVGRPVGSMAKRGVMVTINSHGMLLSFAIHCLMKGYYPEKGYSIEHKNGNKKDFAWKNMRVVKYSVKRSATLKENKNNRKPKCEFVKFNDFIDKWSARFGHWHLGYFYKQNDAIAAYNRCLEYGQNAMFRL